MYIILVYDIKEKRVTKAMKLCRQYLNHIQNSVFEGDITESNLKRLEISFKELIKKEEDSVILFKFRKKEIFDKEIWGIDKNKIDNII